jgi:2'-5' RNA ligase
LLSLQARIVAATSHCGFFPEVRPYQPHITLARSKHNSQPKQIRGLKPNLDRHPKFTRFVAQEFLLYESFLSSAGSHYEVRSRFHLAGS